MEAKMGVKKMYCRCGHADNRRRDASNLMGYGYEGSYQVWIARI